VIRLKRPWQGPDRLPIPNSSLKRLREKVRKITDLLERRYGIPKLEKRVDPLDVLIRTILSQNTNSQNQDRAYRRLKTRFPRWEDVFEAKRRAVIQAIRSGGLANQKARRICEILYWIKEQYGSLSLLPLRKMGSEEIKKAIGNLKGIGPKTVHCLLLFGMGRDAFPVDTHILRVGKHLGFIPQRMDAEKAHEWVEPFVPEGKSLSLHINLIRFGRSLCKAKNPQCHICFLTDECLHSR
jgi:endonuclease-3